MVIIFMWQLYISAYHLYKERGFFSLSQTKSSYFALFLVN